MKFAIALLTLLAGTAQAAPTDFAYGWPLATSGDAGIWQVELSPAMLAASRDPQLRDIEVFNAAGDAVPVAWLPVDLSAIALSDTVTLPLFLVPTTASPNAADSVQLRLQRDAEGRLRSLDTTIAAGTSAASASDVILDASDALRDGARLQRLHLDWPAASADLRVRVAVDTSDDLENWQNRVAAATVLQLRRDGAELSRHSIVFDSPVAQRYLRLRVLDGVLPEGFGVRADRVAEALKTQPQRLWIDAEGRPMDAPAGRSLHHYTLPAALAVRALDIGLIDDNSIANLRVASRSGDDADWRPRTSISAFRLRDGASALVNDPLELSSEERASEWRIEAQPALAKAPTLRLGYRPDRLLFLAQGSGPFQLAVGSVSAQRSEAPVALALDEWRSRHGADWQPALAIAGERHELTGEAAYRLAPEGLPWQRWLLWSVLLIGTGVIGLFALSLLRGPRKPSA